MAVIAIIEDDTAILSVLAEALRRDGFEVDAYHDPIVALPKVIFVPPDLLILNGRMPGMDGIEFFLKFRQFCSVPVIVLSASADEIEHKLGEIGVAADAYVAKPCLTNEAVRIAKLLMSRVRHAGKRAPG